MAKLTKRQKAIAGKIEAGKSYNFVDAAALLTELSTVKFSESVDVTVPTLTVLGRAEPLVRPAAFFNRTEAGVDLVSKVKLRSLYTVMITGVGRPGSIP